MTSQISKQARQAGLYLSYVVGLIMALLPFHAFLTTWAGSNFGNLDVFVVWKEFILIAATALAGWLIWKSKDLRQWLRESWIVRLYLLYIILHVLRALWATGSGILDNDALAHALIINLRFILFFLICGVAGYYSDWLRANWKKIILLPAGVVLAFGILQATVLPNDFMTHFGYGPETIPAIQTIDNNSALQRVQSTLRGANPLGAYLLLVGVTIAITVKNIRLKAVGLLAVGLVLYFSHSRSAWIGAVLVVAVLAWLVISNTRAKRGAFLGLIVLVVIFGTGLYALRNEQRVQDTVFHTSDSSLSPVSSNEARWSAISDAAGDVINDPLGRGPGTAGPASARNDPDPADIAENYYLQIGQEVGVAGMLTYLAILAFVALDLWRRRQDDLALVLFVSLVGLVFVNMVSHAWTDDTLAYLWWGLAGLAIGPRRTAGKRKKALAN
jgi:hypothetical protein